MVPPDYFNKIQQKASSQWDQLDRDLELAGPWHQLFRQVQSPRHVLSELLQNADDAGAKTASVRIENGTLIFEHDGSDFDEKQFASLCRFGFSNKRTLHTIGFRGIGFKSTFSLGDTVEVYTPTLAICFKKRRFTEPVWISDAEPVLQTTVRVKILDSNRKEELHKNLEEWEQSPISLLFFNSLETLSINGHTISRLQVDDAPVLNSIQVELAGANSQSLLLVRSDKVSFPEEAAKEIRSERGVDEKDILLPPCSVEIVLGLSQPNKLYVILPTRVGLGLPFSCNAPFIQDPARFVIKDPSTSPTNRWLLERIGKLAATTLLEWLGNDKLSISERANAYHILSDTLRFNSGLDGTCSQVIIESMLSGLKGYPFVLTTAGALGKEGECVAVPDELFGIWSTTELLSLFAPSSKLLLASEASKSAFKLVQYGWVSSVTSDAVLQRLEQEEGIICPSTWPQLHAMWSFVQNKVGNDWSGDRRRRMKVVPVDGSSSLYSSSEVIRLSSRRDLLSKDDWNFIVSNTSTVAVEWLQWLSELNLKKGGEQMKDDPVSLLLQKLGLHEPSSPDRIISQACSRIFKINEVPLADCVRIAHIMAALGARIPESFRYMTKDARLRAYTEGIVVDETGQLEDITPTSWSQEHLLHDAYLSNFLSCKPESWRQWIRTPSSMLHLFAPIVKKESSFFDRRSLMAFVSSRGSIEPKEYHYQKDHFAILDYDFPNELVEYWNELAKENKDIWVRIAEGIIASPTYYWNDKTEARIDHKRGTHSRQLDCGFVPTKWVDRLRSTACIRDEYNKPHVPAELILRNPDTESLKGIEPFVHSLSDSESTKPLLKLLNVRDTPSGSDKLLSRLEVLANYPDPIHCLPLISRFYDALERIAVRALTTELEFIIETFEKKAVILTDSNEWMTAGEVSIYSDESNAMPSVHASLRGMALWLKIGLPERPTLERTLDWLKSLPSRSVLDKAAIRRVCVALQRDPVQIWNECQHWLSLDATWEPIEKLKYGSMMPSITRWEEKLFPNIKRSTADLQMINADLANSFPFTNLSSLGSKIEFRVTYSVEPNKEGETRGWLTALAEGLCQTCYLNEDETRRIRSSAQRLRQTTLRVSTSLDVIPYVEGIPAGESFSPKVLWQDTTLYVAEQSAIRLYNDLADELARPFSNQKVGDAIAACIERSPEFISEYLKVHFNSKIQTEPESEPVPIKNEPKAEITTEEGPKSTEAPRGQFETPESEILEANIKEAPSIEIENHVTDDAVNIDDTVEAGAKQSNKTLRTKLPLIEIYTQHRRFHWDGIKNCYIHPDGNRIRKSERPFNWEEHTANGELICHLWVTEQNLMNGVEIAAELWTLLSMRPTSASVILAGEDNAPCVFTGQQLMELKDSRQIALHPARYRIAKVSDR